MLKPWGYVTAGVVTPREKVDELFVPRSIFT